MTVFQLQRIEYDERKIENLSLKTAIALSKALGLKLKKEIELETACLFQMDSPMGLTGAYSVQNYLPVMIEFIKLLHSEGKGDFGE